MKRHLFLTVAGLVILLAPGPPAASASTEGADSASWFTILDAATGQEGWFVVKPEAGAEQGVTESFLIEETDGRAWRICGAGRVAGSTHIETLEYFLREVETWYRNELLVGVVEGAEPPYLILGLPPLDELAAYQVAAAHFYEPHWGVSLAYTRGDGSSGAAYQYSYSDESQEIKIEGRTGYRTTLQSFWVRLHYRERELVSRVEGSLFLGGGVSWGTFGWDTEELWHLEYLSLESSWDNSWQFTGKGTGLGYAAGAELSYRLAESVMVCAGIQYQGFHLGSLDYQEQVHKGVPHQPWVNDVPKPSSLDADGWVGLLGLGVIW